MQNKVEIKINFQLLLKTVLLFFLFSSSFFIRFYKLGYSDFYGDETKTFYLDKTIPAFKFFLDQRKGPAQFLTVWVVEKVIGGYDEFYTRVPFALLGVFSVYVLYLISKRLFGFWVGLLTATIFSLNGYFIAFSRTVQYQNLLIFFGLTAIYFFLISSENQNIVKRRFLLFLSAISLAISFLSHYDALVFSIPIAYMLIVSLNRRSEKVTNVFVYFVIPFLLLVSFFYVPYFKFGFFEQNTLNYLERRATGSNFLPNISWYTFYIYNPYFVMPLVFLFLLSYFFHKPTQKEQMIFLWFLLGFISYEYIFSNPGTHNHNYFIPLSIISAIGISKVVNILTSLKLKYLTGFSLFLIFTFSFYIMSQIYLPISKNNYPWVNKTTNKYHLFLYGFPYNRSWREVRAYFLSKGEIAGVSSDDSDTLAEYYLRGFTYTRPGANFWPEYYIMIPYNQVFTVNDYKFYEKFAPYYTLEKEIPTDTGEPVKIFKRIKNNE